MQTLSQMAGGLLGLALLVVALVVVIMWVIFPVVVYFQLKKTAEILVRIEAALLEANSREAAKQLQV